MTHKTLFAFAAVLSAGSAATAVAEAACPDEAAIIVIDESNSMNDPGAATGGTTPKRDLGLALAKNFLAAMPTGTPVAVYGFGNQPQFSLPTTTVIADFSAGYTAGNSTVQITAALQTAHDQTITGNLWTPLAGSVCQAVDDITTNLLSETSGLTDAVDPTCIIPIPPADAATKLQVYLVSDGGENSTPTTDQCSGTDSTTAFDIGGEGAGFGLSAGSWQRHMADKAYTLDANTDGLPNGAFKIIANIALLFNFTNGLGRESGVDGRSSTASDLQSSSIPLPFETFMGSFATATHGTYFESKMMNGVPTKTPQPGDTNPTATISCVDSVDISRVLGAIGHKVSSTDPKFTLADLISRDVNHDQLIDMRDYQLVIKNYGKCS